MAETQDSPMARPMPDLPPASFYLDVYRASPTDRIRMIKDGMRAAEAKRIVAELHFSQGMAFKAPKLSLATVN